MRPKTTYAGIGSRGTPAVVCDLMTKLARVLRHRRATLRTGHAHGADQAFERGAAELAEVYLPWVTFEGHIPIHPQANTMREPSQAAYPIAKRLHPVWANLKQSVQALHARNSHIILGSLLDHPVNFVICWSKGDGGTEQGLRLARDYGISIYNLADPVIRRRAEGMVEVERYAA